MKIVAVFLLVCLAVASAQLYGAYNPGFMGGYGYAGAFPGYGYNGLYGAAVNPYAGGYYGGYYGANPYAANPYVANPYVAGVGAGFGFPAYRK